MNTYVSLEQLEKVAPQQPTRIARTVARLKSIFGPLKFESEEERLAVMSW